MRRGCALVASAMLAGCLAGPAAASQRTTLKVAFSPDRPGHSTSISFSARIVEPAGGLPAPLTRFTMRYPSVLGVAVSGLGLATCARARLEAVGPRGCPANSLMGHGHVLIALPVEAEVVEEQAQVTIVRAPERGEGIALLFYAEGIEPVFAEITFAGLLSEAGRTSEQIAIDVPLVKGVPGGPDVSVLRLDATIGPKGLTYLERVRGKLVPYRPRGILLPARCPPGGFRFADELEFADAGSATASTTVSCRH